MVWQFEGASVHGAHRKNPVFSAEQVIVRLFMFTVYSFSYGSECEEIL